MLINVISLKRRPDRRLSLVRHLEDMQCMYRFWDGEDDRTKMGFINISVSHKRIVNDARHRNLEMVLIAEDDLRFSHPNSLEYFVDKMPRYFDIYFGMIYTGVIQDGRITHGFSGLQFYCIHQRFYETFLSAPANKHLDIWLGGRCHEFNYQVCDPFICGACDGYSDNFKRNWVFNEKKLPRNLYKG